MEECLCSEEPALCFSIIPALLALGFSSLGSRVQPPCVSHLMVSHLMDNGTSLLLDRASSMTSSICFQPGKQWILRWEVHALSTQFHTVSNPVLLACPALLPTLCSSLLFPLRSISQRLSWVGTPLLKEDQATSRTRKSNLPLDQLTLLTQKERTYDMKVEAGWPLSEKACS